ncbi:hypothetical protein D915_001321 [Fasciola hepatica]|uniref:Uncharacterized protein n=1 Tax=Fasciola hepatica TaxID=6192 RepID=A0A4E0RJ25_FASHE|nr:hypothetical protein D915_001321 [Fasciola hepatica]
MFGYPTYSILSLVIVILWLRLSNVQTQTVDSLLEACFGSGFDHLAPRRMRTFSLVHAHSYRTGPGGIELVNRLRPYSCIYGFLFPNDPKVDHLLFNLNEAYVREGKDPYWESAIHAELQIFQYTHHHLFPLYNVSLKPPGQRIRETLVHVYRRQIGPGPVFVGLEHNVPRGINGLRFVHMNLIVTPIYTCHDKDLLINEGGLVVGKSQEHVQDEQKLTTTDEPTDTEQKYLVCSSKGRSGTNMSETVTTYCIPAELMCDSYANCPRNELKLIPDEQVVQCLALGWNDQNTSWIVPIVCSTIILACCVLTTWLYQTNRCQNLCNLLRKRRNLPNRSRSGSTENCTRFLPLPIAPDEELHYDFSGITSAYGDPPPPCPSAPPLLHSQHQQPPPSYQEALKIVLPDYLPVRFIPTPTNSVTPSSYYAGSGWESGLDSLGISAQFSPRTRTSSGPDSGVLPPPSYNQCIQPGSTSFLMNRPGDSSDALKTRRMF